MKRMIVYEVTVRPDDPEVRYYWGRIHHIPASSNDIVLTSAYRGREVVLVAHPAHMAPVFEEGWVLMSNPRYGRVFLSVQVFDEDMEPWRGLPEVESIKRFDKQVWVGYKSAWTGDRMRISGPWGCIDDATGFAADDGGPDAEVQVVNQVEGPMPSCKKQG